MTWTSAQLIAPSSGSVTVTVNGMLSPKANVPPSVGTLTVTVGAVLPTVIVVFAEPLMPFESVTVSLATKTPVVVYVCVGSSSVESVVPLPSKSQA